MLLAVIFVGFLGSIAIDSNWTSIATSQEAKKLAEQGLYRVIERCEEQMGVPTANCQFRVYNNNFERNVDVFVQFWGDDEYGPVVALDIYLGCVQMPRTIRPSAYLRFRTIRFCMRSMCELILKQSIIRCLPHRPLQHCSGSGGLSIWEQDMCS